MLHGTAHPPALGERRPQIESATAKPSYMAYAALMTHYRHCAGCAHATRPCAEGTGLRRAWKAVRWS